jgi:hypothetical protein
MNRAPRTRRVLFVVAVAGLYAARPAQALDSPQVAEVTARLQQAKASHPRLFLTADEERRLKELIASDPLRQRLLRDLLAEADAVLPTAPVERVLEGRRLLDKSRTALQRVLGLALAWRLTGEPRYAERARRELVRVAGFTDWNPSHFLDVAEMTLAVGIGYDWLYGTLDEPTRALLRTAIVEKGLRPSLQHDSWTRSANNWNQVCNGGIAAGAMAVAEHEPKLAAELVARAVDTVPLAMREYAPDGAYPEGPGYWGYGTTYNVILLSALQSALGTDFGLSAQPGFLATADYFLHVHGPTGLHFNYSDAGRGGGSLSPAQFWLASRRQEPHLLFAQWQGLATPSAGGSEARGRTAPFLLLWMPEKLQTPPAPARLSWTGHGHVPVAFHRSSWDPGATWVAVKGGSPSANHAHMDVGTFVMDADGVRWADDLGSQSYHSLESKGVDLWNRAQGSDRWKVFRLGTAAHNVLMVDGQQQRVQGHAPITAAREGRTVLDLSSVYRGLLRRAFRGVAVQADRTVLVQDELEAERGGTVRWAMLTRAEVIVEGPGRAALKLDGRSLSLRVLEPAGAQLRVYATDPPPGPNDAANPGTRIVGFEVRSTPGTPQRLVVHLVPGSVATSTGAPAVSPLSAW